MVVTNYLPTGMILQVERGLTTLLGGENASDVVYPTDSETSLLNVSGTRMVSMDLCGRWKYKS